MQKILIAEDEAMLREAYVTILQHSGYQVAEAGDGEEALEMLEHDPPELLILDMLMPRKGGLEVLADDRLQTLRPRLKVIAFTNLSDPETVEALRLLKVDKYLLKSSMTPNSLVQSVEEVLSAEAGEY